ncbi:hypothetical protein jhhlp_005760 [Lomentospora prolificans]|uniref:Prenylcysteine lyase domain-containing protein n=1 Tax=Lomentospora prolificans TaxID=41688 RepID=A0A2N3N3Z9_9PEZI|nr:hypothetical protein jhhlp_005760 [Lomentospora prolificans]
MVRIVQQLAVLVLSSTSLLGHASVVDAGATSEAGQNIAIIGAGAAGSSAAYHLRRFADEEGIPINITIFESREHAGGRARTVNAYDDPLQPVEQGASIFIRVNTILYDATQEFGLPLVGDDNGVEETLVIWDGENFRYEQKDSSSKWWSYVKLFWKYGMAPLKTKKLVDSTINRFLEMYSEPHFPFKSLTQTAIDLDLVKLTGITGGQFLQESGIGLSFAQDIVQAATRVNYATNLAHIHGLETMVSMAPDGAMQIAGGNWQIFANMVKASTASFLSGSTVTSLELEKSDIADSSSSKYIISTKKTGASDAGEPYANAFDKVIVATPWQYGEIQTSADLIEPAIDEIPYVRLHVTLFTSPFKLSPRFFNLPPGSEAPTTVLTTLHPDSKAEPGSDAAGKAGFFSVSTLRAVTNPKTKQREYLYKVFSPQVLDPFFLSKLLGVEVPDTFTGQATNEDVEPISWYYPHVFNSYPIEFPRVTFQDPILGNGLYYTSGIESFISTMETSALMGKNVARIIVNELAGKDDASEKQSITDEASSTLAPGSQDEL